MAGHILYHYLKTNTPYTVIDIARGTAFHTPAYELDVTNFVRLKEVFLAEKPDVIVNCIGILNQDAEQHPDKAVLMNSYFPHFLAQASSEAGSKVIHISTDCVFNGKKGGYTELSEKDGYGFYAQTKALGEVTYNNHVTLRTSIIGPELKDNGIGLFHWCATINFGPRWEIWAFDVFHQAFKINIWIVDLCYRSINQLTKVVWWNVSSHTNGDTHLAV